MPAPMYIIVVGFILTSENIYEIYVGNRVSVALYFISDKWFLNTLWLPKSFLETSSHLIKLIPILDQPVYTISWQDDEDSGSRLIQVSDNFFCDGYDAIHKVIFYNGEDRAAQLLTFPIEIV